MKILLLGHGVANDGCMRLLNKYKIDYDYKEIDSLDSYYYDYIVKSPGISLHDDIFKSLNGKIISDIGLGYMLLKPKIIGVTGSNGKTTVCSMLYHVLKSKYRVSLCGNIGYSFCEALLDYENIDYYIVEMSSFQLENIDFLDLDICVITNISITHLDHHKTLNEYIMAKRNICINQSINNYLVYNHDNIYVNQIAKDCNSKKIMFSFKSILGDLFILNGYIYYKYKRILKIEEMYIFKTENIMAVLGVLAALNFNLKKGCKLLRTFKEVEYRLTKINDFIYNDAKSTNFASTEAALLSLKRVKLICGGYDRGVNIILSQSALDNIVKVYCYGESKERVNTYMIDREIECNKFDNLEEAFNQAIKERKDEEIILYSPMFASFDQYGGYKERGEEFQRLVNEYIKKQTKDNY